MSYQDIVAKLEREEIRLASIGKRAYAACIDETIISLLFIATYYDAFAQAATYEQRIAIISSLFLQFIGLKILYQAFFTWYYGASLGKIAAKIACVDVVLLDKPSFAASLSRAVVAVISQICLYLGFAWALGNEARQTWHDLAAKTAVIDVA